MINNLDLTLDCDNFSVEGPTLRMFLEAYGIYDTCLKDISTIKDEIEKLSKLQEKYLKMKDNILERINYLSKLETRTIIKIEEKGENKDDYSLTAKIYKISEDLKILVNFIDEEIFDYADSDECLENYLIEVLEKYPDIRIYSNKDINYTYSSLKHLENLA